MMCHHHLIDLLMVNHVHVCLSDARDWFVEQIDDHIDDKEISFLDCEYFEYDVEDWMRWKMIVRNICNDKAKKKIKETTVNDSKEEIVLLTCSPVCVRKCRVKFAERGKTFPQYEQVYLSLLFKRVFKYCNLLLFG